MESELPFKGEPEAEITLPSRPISRAESYLILFQSIGDESLFLLLRCCALWVLWLMLAGIPLRTVVVLAGAAAVTAWYVLKLVECWRAFKAKPGAATPLSYRYVSRAQFFRLAIADKELPTSLRIKMRYRLYLMILASFLGEFLLLVVLVVLAHALWVFVSLPILLPLRIFAALVGLAAIGALIRWRIKKNISYWRTPSMRYYMNASAKLD